MSQSSRRSRRKAAGRPSDARSSARSVLRDLAEDVRYLEVKERLGEALTPSERFRLEVARGGSESGSGSGPETAGGGS